MKGFSISIALNVDVPKLMRLVNSAYRGEEAKKGWTHEANLVEGNFRTDENSLKDSMLNPNAVILKYSDGGVIAGCVYLEKKINILYLGMLSVSPEIQAQGIGKKLLLAAEDHAKKTDCQAIEMRVISVRKELIEWYERNGYTKTNRREPFHNDGRFGLPLQTIEFIVLEKKIVS